MPANALTDDFPGTLKAELPGDFALEFRDRQSALEQTKFGSSAWYGLRVSSAP